MYIVQLDGGACAAAAASLCCAIGCVCSSRPQHQQQPPGCGAQPQQTAGKLATIAPVGTAQSPVDISRRAATAACGSLDDVVVVQLMEHRQLTEIRRRRGALRDGREEALRLAALVLLVGLGHIYAVAFEKLGALQKEMEKHLRWFCI